MFFFKKEESNKPKRFVVVLGSSPLAMFLTYILQQNNIEVEVLTSMDKVKKQDEYVFKSNIQSQNFSFKSVRFLEKKPEYCFVASSFNEYKNDLLLLADNIFKDVKIVNFSSFYNREIIKQMEGIKEIRAYFNGWLVKNKKEVVLLNRSSEIKVCCKVEMLSDLQVLLNDKRLDVKIEKNSKKLFLQNLIPWFLGNLLVLSYQRNITELLANNEVRQEVSSVVKEILQLLGCNDNLVDEASVLPNIYAFPDNFVSEFASDRGVLILSEIIKGINGFDTPKTFKLIASAIKKY